MKTYVSQWQKIPRSIKKEYEQGATLFELAVKYKTSIQAIRFALFAYKTKMRPPGGKIPGRSHHARKLSDDDLLLILKLDKENVPHAEIARKFSNNIRTISRERIRQICAQAGHEPRWGRIPHKDEQKRAAALARKQAKEDRVRRASEAWIAGKSMGEISYIMFGTKKTMGYINNRIGEYRKQYGLDLFPYRRPHHWSVLTANQRVNRIKSMARVWNSSADSREIMRRFHYKSMACVSAALSHLRAKYPDLFPTREEIIKRKMSK